MPCMSRRDFQAPARNGVLRGWVTGEGKPVLLLHGGPGLSFDYLEALAADIGNGYEVAAYQQRGLSPSTTEGPYDVATHVSDVAGVLDALGWTRATVVGHSWGGHLAMHVAVALGDRLDGVLCVDPLGGVGDGGSALFEKAMFDRSPADVRDRARQLDERAMAGEGTVEDALESLRLVWPAYFAEWDRATEMPPMRISLEGYSGTWESLKQQLPRLEAALPSVTTQVGFVLGAASPMPATAATDSAALIPGAWTQVVEAAGHFPWLERPGCVRAAVLRLTSG
jgi:pimeloyl-ACP methyl ester carboxylesterase